jgi:hypothetical protein
MSKVTKARHWCFVAYPESVAPDWLEKIKLSGLKCAISPLHDRDEHSDPMCDDGKKAHWHCIISWDGPQTYNAASAFTVDKLKATHPQKLESVRGYYRYFTHADDPDKFQYDPSGIQLIGGFDITEHCELTRSERMRLIGDVQDFIEDNDITEYRRLCFALKQAEMREEWDVAVSNTLFFNSYITSRRSELAAVRAADERRHEIDHGRKSDGDPEMIADLRAPE